MKKLLFFSLLSAFALISCKNDSTEDIAYSITGLWHPAKEIVVSGANGTELSGNAVSDCVKTSSYNFRKDGWVYISTYDSNSGGTCGLTASYQKKYTYDNVNRILIIGDLDYYELDKLTDHEMYLITDASTDVNSDGVKDKKILVLTK